jgi:hypothetical protein
MEHADIPNPSRTETTDRIAAAIEHVRRLAIATDDSDEALARVRSVALDLARTYGFEVVLYDRSNERWTDHPHPEGPVTVDELDGKDRDHLVDQLREFAAAGVVATAWLATVPALTAMLDVMQTLDVDAVMLPGSLDEPTLADRLQSGSSPSAMVQRVADLNLAQPPVMFEVPESGPIRVVEYSVGD